MSRKVKEGDRVYVKTPLYEDWAVVVGFVADPHHDIMVELENGDPHGHRWTRVSNQDINQEE